MNKIRFKLYMETRIQDKKPKCLIIVGMHRSGTSCLTGSLQQAGLFLGKISKNNKFNLKGNREKEEIIQLNDSILSYNGNRWDNPPTNALWNKSHQKKRDKIISGLANKNYYFWGFKDARTLLVLPFWKEKIDDIQFVGTFRHPLNVARSLYFRNRFPYEKSFRLWEHYNNLMLKLFEQSEFPIISFDSSPEKYLNSIRILIKKIGLDENKFNTNQQFFDNSLRHFVNEKNQVIIPKHIINLYNKLNTIYKRQFSCDNYIL